MRRFGSERIAGLMERLGMEEDVPIEHRHHLQVDRERPDQGRGPQLRHAQARRPVRRRDEQAPRGDLRRPPRDRRRRGHARQGRGDDRRPRSRAIVDANCGEGKDAEPDYDGIVAAYTALVPNAKLKLDDIDGLDARRPDRRSARRTPTRAYEEVEAALRRRERCARSSATSCSRSSTGSGSST